LDYSKLLTAVEVTTRQLSPLLLHAFSVSDIDLGPEQSAIKKSSDMTPREQAERHLYKDSEGTLILPMANVLKSIIEAGQFHKLGQKLITTRDRSLVPGGITLPATHYVIDPQEWEVESRRVVNPNNKAAIISHRPRFDRWSLTFTMLIDPVVFTMSIARKLVDDAGKRIGLGSFRPICKGPFGKFIVIRWNELDPSKI
jgi:hypothetical protein